MIDVERNSKKPLNNLGNSRACPYLGFPAKSFWAIEQRLGQYFHVDLREFGRLPRMWLGQDQTGISSKACPPSRNGRWVCSKDSGNFDLLAPFLQGSNGSLPNDFQFLSRAFWTHLQPPYAPKIHGI